MRSGSSRRKPNARRRGLAGGRGRGSLGRCCRRAVCSGRPAAGPCTGGFPGMVSKTLVRLASAVNRRRMKLLLGIALLAYVACE